MDDVAFHGVVQTGQRRCGGFAPGQHETRRRLQQGNKDEGPFAQAWMRQRQRVRMKDMVIKQEHVQIQRAGSEATLAAAVTAVRPLDGVEPAQQRMRRQRGVPSEAGDLVQEPRLVAVALGFGAVDARRHTEAQARDKRESLQGGGEALRRVPDGPRRVGAQTDIDHRDLMRSTASIKRSVSNVREMRNHPSPGAPKPLPGVSTTPFSWIMRVTNSAEVP